MSLHKKPLTEVEKSGLIAHGLPVETPSQNADCFRLGVAWALRKEFTCIGVRQPTDERSVFWVVGGQAGKKPILARFNNYKALGGQTNHWQTLSHEDFSMIGTRWMEINQPDIDNGGNTHAIK